MVASLCLGTVSILRVAGANIRYWEVFLGLCLFRSISLRMLQGRIGLQANLQTVIFALLVLASVASSYNAVDMGLYLKQFVLFLAMLLLSLQVGFRHERDQLLCLYPWFVYPGVLIALWGIIEWLYFNENLTVYSADGILIPRAQSLFAEPNEFSQFLSVVFAFVFSAVVLRQRRWSKKITYLSMVIVCVAQILSLSRGGLLSCGVQMAAFLVLRWVSGQRVSGVLTKAFVAFGLVLSVVWVLAASNTLPVIDVFWARIQTTLSTTDVTTSIRLETIQKAALAPMESVSTLIVGIGFGNLPTVLGKDVANSSNLLVDVFAEMGIAGFVVFSGLLAAGFLIPLTRARVIARNLDPALQTVFYGSYLSFLGLVVGGLTSPTHMLNVFWFVCGAVFAVSSWRPDLAQCKPAQPGHSVYRPVLGAVQESSSCQ